MKNKKIVFTLLLLTVLLSINLVSATDIDNNQTTDISIQQSTIQETNEIQNDITADTKEITKKTDDTVKEATSTQVDVNNYGELVSQVNKIQQGTQKEYIINLKPGNYYATSSMILTSSDVKYKITINGNNLTLDGEDDYKFIKIEDCSLILKNITLKNFYTDHNGIINIKNANLSFVDSSLTYNSAYGGGSVVYSEDSNINVINSYFTKNSATYDGGAIYSYTSNLTVYNSTFTENTARYGAVIYSYMSDTIISKSTFKENNCQKGGVINLNRGNITINDSSLKNNRANFGGAIYSYSVTSRIINSTLTNNTASEGAAINSQKDNYNIVNSKILNNEASDGAIYTQYSNFNITDSILSKNTAIYYGGAIRSYSSNFNINNTTLADNNAGAYSGAIHEFHGTYNIINSTISNNTAKEYGGAIYTSGAESTIVNSTLTDNIASYGGAINSFKSNCTITNTNLTNNKAIAGGAIYNDSSVLNIKKSNFKNNKADEENDIYNAIGKTAIYLKKINEKNYRDNITISGNISVNGKQPVNRNLNILLLVNDMQLKLRTYYNGKFNTAIKLNSTGTWTVKAVFEGIDGFLPSNASTSFNATKRDTFLNSNTFIGLLNAPTTIKGNLTDKTSTKLRNANIYIKVNNKQYHLLTDKNGVFSLNYTPTIKGTHNITILYKGNKNYEASNITTRLEVGEDILINSSYYRDNISIIALLTDNNKILKNTYANLTLNNQTITLKSDDNGVIYYNCKSEFAGTNTLKIEYNNNIITETFTTKKRTTNLTLSLPKTANINEIMTISGKLTDQSNTKLRNANIYINLNGTTIHTLTQKDGTYTHYNTAISRGIYIISVTYKGNRNYEGTTITSAVNLI